MEWARWFETAERHVALEKVGGIRISTVFLGLDHNFSMNGNPVLFETMTFVGRWTEDEMRRYCTYEEAEAGHREIVENIRCHPLSRIVLPWMKFILHRLRSATIEAGNKVLAWMWPMVIEMQSAIDKAKAKYRAWKKIIETWFKE